jgi:hypothetical protein
MVQNVFETGLQLCFWRRKQLIRLESNCRKSASSQETIMDVFDWISDIGIHLPLTTTIIMHLRVAPLRDSFILALIIQPT